MTEMKERPVATTLSEALFNPSVVVPRTRLYWAAALILIGLAFVINVLPYLIIMRATDFSAVFQASILGVLVYLLIYPWFCLLGGRLRDAGFHPAWFIALVVGWSVLSAVAGGIVTIGAMVEASPEILDSVEAASADEGASFGELMEAQLEASRRMIELTFWPTQIASAVSSLLVVGLLALFPSRLDDNPHRWKRYYVPPANTDKPSV